jgi:hypothetical protein
MAITEQRQAGRKSATKPQGTKRRQPGADFYRVEVRPRKGFVTFRTQDVGGKGRIERVAGQRQSGSWGTVAWLISKQDAHVSGRTLVADSRDAKQVFRRLGGKPVHRSGNRFVTPNRPELTGVTKPSMSQRIARSRRVQRSQRTR